MKNEIVSIIVPVYNVDDFLNCCIESIVNQSYRDIEIILVDDGSTDMSGQICDDWAQKDSRIVCFHKTNGGLSSARNYGLRHVSGAYIWFIDSDDFISSNAVEVLMKTIKEEDVDFVSFMHRHVSENERDIFENNLDEYTRRNYFSSDIFREFLMNQHFGVPVWNKLYKKELLEGIEFCVGNLREDNYFTPEVMFRAKSACEISCELYFYRIRKSSLSFSKSIKAEYDLADAWEHTLGLISDRSDVFFEVNTRYLAQLISLFFKEERENRKKIMERYRRNVCVSVRYMSLFRILWIECFSISPKLYSIIMLLAQMVTRKGGENRNSRLRRRM